MPFNPRKFSVVDFSLKSFVTGRASLLEELVAEKVLLLKDFAAGRASLLEELVAERSFVAEMLRKLHHINCNNC